MPRIARVVAPGFTHHITQRGVRSMDVFSSDEDKTAYLHLVREYGSKFGVTFSAYCLMSNHVHLMAIPAEEDSLAKAIGEAHKHYTRMFNLRSGARGYLFQGRFFSCPLDERHAIAAVAYIERNPVRAGMVKNAWDYPWSSAMFHCGVKKTDPLVTETDIFSTIGDWRDFLRREPHEAEEISKKVRSGRPCGGEGFIKALERTTNRELTAVHVGRPKKK